MDRIRAACDFLDEHRRTRQPAAALPPDLVPRTLAEGYEIQELLVRRLLDRFGSRPIGYKIACTSELAQRALAVDGPFFGILMTHSSHAGPATLPASGFNVRCAEAEFGFEMADDVPAGPTYTAETIRPFVAAAIPGLEIVDHRYHDWKTVGAPSLLADNAIHGAWVFGEPAAGSRDIDFARHPTALVVNDGERTYPGSGAAVLGDPLNVLAWLANELPKYGRRLSRGDRVTTGVTTDIYLAVAGDRLAAEFGALGRVELNFV